MGHEKQRKVVILLSQIHMRIGDAVILGFCGY